MRRLALLACILGMACREVPTAGSAQPVTLRLLSGDGQSGIVGYRLSAPAVLQVLNADGTAAIGQPISFTASDETVSIETFNANGQDRYDALTTDSIGTLRVWIRLGATLGSQTIWAHAGPDLLLQPVTITASASSNLLQSVDGGEYDMCGIDMQGRLGCWVPPSTQRIDTVARLRIATAPVPFTQVTVPLDYISQGGPGFSARQHTEGCALATTGRPWCFAVDRGANITGLEELAGSYPPFTQITSADEIVSYCGLTATGEAWCWGSNNVNGQLGDGTHTPHASPAPVLTSARFVQLDMDNHACGLTGDGQVWCWGKNSNHQTGVGTTTEDILTPTLVNSAVRFTKVRIDAFNNASCGLVAGAPMYCWGNVTPMQLRSGNSFSSTSISTPSQMTGTAGFPVEMMVVAGVHVVYKSNATFDWGGDLYEATGAEALSPWLTPARGAARMLGDVKTIHSWEYTCGTAILGGATLCPSVEGIVGWYMYPGVRGGGFPPVAGVPFP